MVQKDCAANNDFSKAYTSPSCQFCFFLDNTSLLLLGIAIN